MQVPVIKDYKEGSNLFVCVLWESVSKTLFICQFSRWWDIDENHITIICGWLVSRENCL